MPNSWIVDMHHFLDEGGLPVARRGTLVPFLGAIVETVSASADAGVPISHVRCRRRPRHQPCPGVIDAFLESDSLAIAWYCPACGDDGHIANWMGTPWDRRPLRVAPPGSRSVSSTPTFTPAAERAWNRFPGSVRVRLLNNVFCVQCRGGTSMALAGGTVKRGDLVLKGTCTRCSHEVARVVEGAA
jgi:hypothetical protein